MAMAPSTSTSTSTPDVLVYASDKTELAEEHNVTEECGMWNMECGMWNVGE